MAKKVGLKDIAREVGVSTALVSYVLNNQKQDRISQDVSRKIKDVAASMGYRGNQLARSLKTNKTFSIGFMVGDIASPYFAGMAREIEDEADRHNYTVFFCSSDENPDKSARLINSLLSRQVDGIIMAAPENAFAQVADLEKMGIPLVLVDRYYPELSTSYVAIDNYGAASSAVEHMIRGGSRRIGYISFHDSLFHMSERKRGYEESLRKHGIKVDSAWIKGLADEQIEASVISSIDALLAPGDPVDGILFASITIATFALKYINTLSLRVPSDLAIVSFDESPAFELFYAPLTHIRQPVGEMGRMATQILLESIAGNDKLTQVHLQAELVRGVSGWHIPGEADS